MEKVLVERVKMTGACYRLLWIQKGLRDGRSGAGENCWETYTMEARNSKGLT